MKFFRSVIFFFLLIASLAVFALSIFALKFDSNHYKTEIAKLISDQTGNQLNINGDLSLSIFPSISIQMGQASLENTEGFSGKYLAQSEAADISVKLMPLLQQKLEVDAVTLHGLNLNLHRKSDGSTNWQSLFPQQKTTIDKDSDFDEIIGNMIAGLTVAGISVKDSQLNWRDDSTGKQIELSALNLKTGAYRADKPIDVTLSTQLKQNEPSLKLALDGSTRLKLNKDTKNFSLSNLNLNSTITGAAVSGGQIDAHLTGDISGNADTIRIPNLNLKTTINNGFVSGGKLTATLSGKTLINTKQQQISVDNMALDSMLSGKIVQGGTLNTNIRAKTHYDMANNKLKLSGMTSQTKLQNGALGQGQLDATVNGDTDVNLAKSFITVQGMNSQIQLQNGPLEQGQLNAKISGNTQVDLAQSSVNIQALDLDGNLNSNKVPGGKLAHQAKGSLNLNWNSQNINADLSALMVQLANLQLTGAAKISQSMTAPEVTGSFKSNTFNLKQLLQTLDITPPKTQKPELLQQAQMNFSVSANPDKADFSKLNIKLDESNISGKLAVKNFATPHIRGDIAIDRLNVDNYVEPDDANKQSTPGAAALLPLAAMRNMDVDASLAIGSMVYNRIRMNDAKVKLFAQGGKVKADPITANLYKGKYKGNILLDTAKATPSFTMQHKLSGLRSEGILFDLFQDKIVTGSAFLTSKVTSKGNSVAAIKQNLSGTMNVEFHDGTIRDSNFAKETAIAIAAFERRKTDGDGKEQVKFTKLTGDWVIEQGIFKTDEMVMQAPKFRVLGKGDANINNDTLDFRLNIGRNEKEGRDEIFIPLRIYGAFDNLKYQLRLDDLIKQLAREELRKEEDKLKEKLKREEDRARQKLKEEEDRAKAKLEAKARAKAEELKQKAEREAQRLRDRAKAEEQRLREKLNDETRQLGDKLKDKVGDDLTNKLKEQEDKLKEKFRNLF